MGLRQRVDDLEPARTGGQADGRRDAGKRPIRPGACGSRRAERAKTWGTLDAIEEDSRSAGLTDPSRDRADLQVPVDLLVDLLEFSQGAERFEVFAQAAIVDRPIHARESPPLIGSERPWTRRGRS